MIMHVMSNIDSAGRIKAIGYCSIFLLVLVAGFWSSSVPLADSSFALGSVTVGSDRQILAHVDGGKIEQILVKIGEEVDKGQALVKLNDQSLRTELNLLLYQLYGKQATLDRLEAERQRATTLEFRQSLLTAATADPIVREMTDGEQRNFESRLNSLQIKIATLEHEANQAIDRKKKLALALGSVERQIAIINQKIADTNMLITRGFGRRAILTEHKLEMERLITERISIEKQLVDSDAAILDVDLKKSSLYAEKQSNIEGELLKIEQDIIQMKERIKFLQNKIKDTTIASNIDGIIVDMHIRSENDVILPATPILEIIPNDSRLLVEARIAPYEIEGIHEGAKVEVRFPAFITRDIPSVVGEVSLVSADVIADDRNPYYRVHVFVDDWQKLSGDIDVIPGMPAEIIIRKESRTLIDYVLGPLVEHFARALL